MQSLALQFGCDIAIELAVDLESAQISAVFDSRPASPLRYLAYPLPGSIVGVPGCFGRGDAGDSLCGRLQFVLEVPSHQGEMRHGRHVTMRIIRIFCGVNAI